MATYKEIHGVKVQYRDSDATAIEGDVWYNSSTGVLKMYASAGSWATGGNLGTARYYIKGCGIQTAAIVFGGLDADGVADESYTYDGTDWTDIGAMANNRQMLGGCGTSTAALGAGGYPVPARGADTEEYDGSSWTNSGNMNNARSELGAAGIQTAGLAIGGEEPPGGVTRLETYDGSTWSTSPATLSTARVGAAATGSSTAAFIAGGPSASTATEEFTIAATERSVDTT